VPAVRPEFGPTLPELLAPRLRRLPRGVRAALAAVVLVVVLGAAVVVLGRGGDHAVVVRAPVTFNLQYPSGLVRVAPRPGELLRLESPRGARYPLLYVVRPSTLPPYRGDVNGILPFFSARLIREMQRANPEFVLRGEGRMRLNENATGYGLQFQTRVGGRLTFGRRLLLYPGETVVRAGVDVLMLARASPTVPNVDAVGGAGPLKLAMRTFRFGTEHP
jgi:hypothetical protein